jgi:hypothetical protein
LLQHETPRIEDTRVTLDRLGPRIVFVAGAIGLIALAASLALGLAAGDGLRRFGFSYLVSYAFFLSLSLGALAFVPLQYVTRSSWSVVIRRLAEIMAANLPLLALLSLPILFDLDRLYAWAGEVHGEEAALLAPKQPYLNATFFVIRWIAYLTVWSGLALYFWRTSLRQDATRETRLTLAMENRSGVALVIYALTVTLAAMDLLMSLDFAWFSTIFGVFYFAGGFVCFFAALTLATLLLQRSGRLEGIVSMEHYHDYGKAMFAFSFFWAYIAFSQYLLYWYANIPEETTWFLARSQTGWGWMGIAVLFGAFILPFLGLVSRYAKRRRGLLAFWAVWILFFQWLNLYWVTMPAFGSGTVAFGVIDATCFVGIGGLWVAGLAGLAGRRALVPMGDPRLQASLEFENA